MNHSIDSQWLQQSIRFSFLGMSPSTPRTSSVDPVPIERDPRFRKIVEGVLFSRRFILSYQIVALGFIILVSIVHWAKKYIRWRRRKLSKKSHVRRQTFNREQSQTSDDDIREASLLSSPGSSTSEESTTPPNAIKDVGETTSLLRGLQTPKLRYIGPWISPMTSLKAFLIYQPAPILKGYIELPSNGTFLVILVLFGLNTFYITFLINFNLDEIFVFADRCGLVFISNLPWLYVLAAKTQPIKLITGQSYESLNIYHRRLGEIMCLVALLHALGMFGVWYTILQPVGFSLLRYLTENIVLLGIGAFVAFELLYFTSLATLRQIWYEGFLGMHIMLQIAALLFLFFHHHNSRPYVGVAICIFTIDRFVYRFGLKSTTALAHVEVMEDGGTVRLSSNLMLTQNGTIFSVVGRSVLRGWKASDHVFISIPSLARKHILQGHPFSIMSPSASPEFHQEARLDLLIKARDGFSADLLREAAKRENLLVRLDGPYGSSQGRDLLQDSNLALIVAGGSGIAVAWPVIHFLINQAQNGDPELASDMSLSKQKVILIWVIRKQSHMSWIGRHSIQEVEKKGADVIITKATEEYGRPNLELMIDDILEKYRNMKRIGVLVSGPDGMNRAVRNKCSVLIGAGFDVNVAVEKYGW